MSNPYSGRSRAWLSTLLVLALLSLGSSLSLAAGRDPFPFRHPANASTKPRVKLAPRTGRSLEALNGRRIRAKGPYEREYWYWYQRSRPSGVFPHGAELAAQRRADAFTSAYWSKSRQGRIRPVGVAGGVTSGTWKELGPRGTDESSYGPGVVGGRIMSILLQKPQNRILIGSASGGIWRRALTSGSKFTPQSDFASALSVGALAADPNKPDTIYAGTGEPGVNIDAFGGAGILKSTNGGTTWARVDNGIFDGSKITNIWVDPGNGQHLLASALYQGLYDSTDGGVSWRQISNSPSMTFAVSPADPKRILLSDSEPFGDPAHDLLLSTDGGASFTPIVGPWQSSGGTVGRIDLSWSTKDPNVVWAYAAEPIAGTDNGKSGAYQSTNAGQSFNAAFPVTGEGQGWYNNPIAVSTTDPNTVLFGAVDMFKGTVGGQASAVTNWFTVANLAFIHADQHAIVFDPADGNIAYAGNDGGLWITTDGGKNWSDMNAGLGITQFYYGAVGANNGIDSIFGGTQDNGSQRVDSGLAWIETIGGDGFGCVADPQNDNVLYGSLYNSQYFISQDGARSFVALPDLPLLGGEATPFVSTIAIDPSDGTRVFGAAQRVYLGISNRQDSVTWSPLSGSALFPTTTVSRIAVAPSAGNTVYAAGDGNLQRTTTAADPWSDISPPGGQFITGIAVHPTKPDYVVVSRSGFSGQQVMRSTDGGATWGDVTANLPNVPANGIVLQPDGAALDAYLATDAGVYFADLNAGSISWVPAGTGLPNVHVFDILLAEKGTRVLAFTHGRGVWSLQSGGGGTATITLAATALSSTSIKLDWNDPFTNETGWEVERQTGSTFNRIASRSANTITFNDTGLAASTTYTYRVRAVLPTGTSNYSNQASTTTQTGSGGGPPAAPDNLTATGTSSSKIRLAWNDNSSSETGFEIDRKTGTGNFARIVTTAPDATSFNDGGLKSNTAYTYRVRAINNSGPSAYSNEATAFTLPAVPTGLVVSVPAPPPGRTQLNLAWHDASDAPSDFRVERSLDGQSFSEVAQTTAPAVTYGDTGLTGNTTYYYRVRASNASGFSGYSTVGSATTLPAPPLPITGLTAIVVSYKEIDLNWEDNSLDETGFRIIRKVENASYQPLQSVGANVTSYQDNSVLPNTTYAYKVIAFNTGGDSPESREAGGTTPPAPPGAPSNLVVTPVSASANKLAWKDNSKDETGFYVEQSPDDFADPAKIQRIGVSANVTTFTNTGLASNTLYYYRVLATDRGTDSPPTNTASGLTFPAAPGSFKAVVPPAPAGRTQINLSWTDQSANPTVFKVERSVDGGTTFILRTTTALGAKTFQDTGLTPNKTYVYRVKGNNATGDSAPSSQSRATTLPTPPAGPDGLSVGPPPAPAGRTQLNLLWADESNNETGFRIERSLDGGSTFSKVATVGPNVATYQDKGLTPATFYTYRVIAFNTGGDSSPGGPTSAATLPDPPAAPESLTVTALSQSSLRLGWADVNSNEEGVKIERSQGGGSFSPVGKTGANVKSFTDTGLTADTLYSYRVRAFNAGGDSDYSNVASGRTEPVAPGGPTGLTAAPGSAGEIDLTWRDGGNNEAGFKVERGTDGKSFTEVGGTGPNVTKFSDEGLAPDTLYYYRVRSFNAGGASAYSNTAQARTIPDPPAAPSGLAVKPLSASALRLTWSDKSSNETGFHVERKSLSTEFKEVGSVGANVATWDDSGLDSNSTYTYRVRALNAGGFSDYSNTDSGLTLPAVPSGLSVAVVSESELDLSWVDESAQPSAFKVERSTDGIAFALQSATAVGDVSFQDSGLTPGKTYFYRVRATNGSGDSDPSAVASAATIPSPPSAPAGLSVSTKSQSELVLSWTDKSNNESGFKIERSQGGGSFTQIATVGTDQKSYTDTGLQPDSSYSYRVRAFNPGGDSAYSNVADGKTLPAPPGAPGNLTVQAVSSSELDLAWRDNSSTETGFEVERSDDGGKSFTRIATAPAGATSFQDKGLAAGSSHAYRVRAVNAGGASAYSNVADGKTLPAPPQAPDGLTANQDGPRSVVLSWTDRSDSEDGFHIERKTGEDGSFEPIAQAAKNATKYSDATAAAGKTYVYRVRAFNAGGDSAPSNEARVDVFPQVKSLTLAKASVRGGHPTTATVTLTAPAPAAMTITLTSSGPQAKVPGTVKIDAGQTTASFTVTTTRVRRPKVTVTLTASGGGGKATAALTIRRR